MTTACNVLLPGGINGDCSIPMSEVKNILICDKDVKFTYANKKVLSNWTDLIKQDLTIYAVMSLDSYNNTTDDPNITTGSVSKAKNFGRDGLPSFEFFLSSNFCDFQEVYRTLEGGNYGIFYELQNGTILGTMDQSGTEIGYYKPFKCTIKASTKLLPEVDASNVAFKVYVGHTNATQLMNQFLFEPIWDTSELVEAMPIGLNMVMTDVAGTTQLVHVTQRCGAAYTGLVTADFDESATMSNVSTPLVTMTTESGGGDYILTPTKAVSPVVLVDGDVLACRIKILDGSDVTHLSNWIKIQGVTA